MPSNCFTPMWPEVMRFTLLDNCGNPIYGPQSTFVTDAFSQVVIAKEIEEGAEYTQTKANGQVCASSKQPDSLKWYTWTIDFCAVDPELFAMANDKYTRVYDYMANVVGWDEKYQMNSSNAIAVEMWTKVQGNIDACANETTQGAWGFVGGYKLINARTGDEMTFAGEPNPFQWTAISDPGSRWGNGPYDIQLNEGDPPQPGPWITPVPSDHSLRVATLDVAPPEPTCGGMPLNNPDAPDLVVARGETDMEVCASMPNAEGTWVIDFGDGSPTQQWNPADQEQLCHTYQREDTFYIGVWRPNNERMYTSAQVTVPQTMTLTVQPNSGNVPLEVTATVAGASAQPSVMWGD